MTQLTIPNPQDLQGQTAFDPAGNEVGPIVGVYLDNATRRPEWAAVQLDASSLTLVPLEGARTARGGLEVSFDRDVIALSPFRQEDLVREVSHETEEELYGYYGLRRAENGQADGYGGNGNGHVAPPSPVEEAQEEVQEEVKETVGTAGERATEVAAAARSQAAAVVQTARQEAAEVVGEVSSQARAIVGGTRSQLAGQGSTQLQALADGMHRLAGQALALARGNPEMAGPVADVVGKAGRELQSVAQRVSVKGGTGVLDDASRVVRQRPRAAILGTAVALVAGGKLLRSPAGDKVKAKLAPLKDQAAQVGRNVADELKPVAQQRVERMKAVATNAADQLKSEAQGTAKHVKGQATRSARVVQRTAKQSAGTVKGSARSSARTTTSTAKRSARAAAPATPAKPPTQTATAKRSTRATAPAAPRKRPARAASPAT